MRLKASHPPRTTPYLSTDVSAYAEHVGVKRHEGGSMGETSTLYAPIKTITALRGSAAIPTAGDACVFMT